MPRLLASLALSPRGAEGDTARAMSQKNVELVRQGLEAVNRDDRATAARLLAPDLEWHSLAGPLVGVETIRGREAMLKFWQDAAETFEGYRASVEELTDLGNDRVLVVARWGGHGRGSDVEVDQRFASIYEIRDGMLASVRDYETREEALEAAGLSE